MKARGPSLTNWSCGAARLLALASAPIGCGRINFGSAGDAGADHATGPFGIPAPIVELDVGYCDDPSLTVDELEIVFTKGGSGTCDLWSSTRPLLDAPWLSPGDVGSAISTTSCESTPELARDGLAIWFARANGLFESSRASRSLPWQAPILLDLGGDAAAPTFTGDGLTMYFYDDRTTAGDIDLYVATRADLTAPWALPRRVDELATPFSDRSPHVSADGLELWFVSDRPGGAGGEDLWVAARSTASEPFGPPVPVVELNTPDGEDDPWVSADGRRIYFARRSSTMPATLYSASR